MPNDTDSSVVDAVVAADQVAATKTFADEHLTKEFFTEALINGLQTAVVVVDVQLSSGSNIGDNYCSDIYRARVSYRRNDAADIVETISLIIKAMPYTEVRTDLLEDLDVYAKEVQMYTETLPLITQLLDGERLSAKCFHAVKKPVPLIVFEDLKAAGFVMADRMSGLDEQHCAVVIEKLGRFHAASMRLAEQQPSAMARYKYGIIKPNSKPSPIVEAMLQDGINIVAELVGTWPGYEAHAHKLSVIADKFIEKLDKVCNRSRPAYRVLNHGDMWVNNMLFKYDAPAGGRPVDVCFVDYQMPVFDSPGHDLNYFLNTSPQQAVREQRSEYILELYHAAFACTLVKLQSAEAGVWGMAELRSECRARELYGLLAAVGILPLVLMTHSATGASASLEGLGEGADAAEQMKQAVYYNPHYVAAMRSLVARYEEVGFLDRATAIEA